MIRLPVSLGALDALEDLNVASNKLKTLCTVTGTSPAGADNRPYIQFCFANVRVALPSASRNNVQLYCGVATASCACCADTASGVHTLLALLSI